MRMQAKEAAKQLDAEQLAALPEPGEVDFLCGGPPCQGYSGMNRFNKGDDLRPCLLDYPPLDIGNTSCLGHAHLAHNRCSQLTHHVHLWLLRP